MKEPRITLKSCPKIWTRDLDKAASPVQTIAHVRERLAHVSQDIVAGAKRIDAGRLGIPVFLGICGADARAVMPTRKQMGKGSSPEQAEASALMELMERFAFFSFWKDNPHMVEATWSEAEKLFGEKLIPVGEILRSVNDSLEAAPAKKILDRVSWRFYPATCLAEGRTVWLPIDWFRMLGEFNGSSAGNTAEESLLQGLSELVERHVSCIADRTRPCLPTIRPESCADPILAGLIRAFKSNGIKLVLKDMSLGMPLPTVGAIAWDPSTFPDSSEIVFTAGTASSPAKAAIRAVTEVAQLGGDFCTNSCYEASGLPKFTELRQCQWLLEGPDASLDSLPDISGDDIAGELMAAVRGLSPINVYAVETTHQLLGIPCHYSMAPGLAFRERDRNQSLGLFVGRKLAEEADFNTAAAGLALLAEISPRAHYLPFFQGLLRLRMNENEKACALFREAAPMQPDDEARALALFYAGYSLTLVRRWRESLRDLREAARLCPQMKEYANLLGVALFKTGAYAEAEDSFNNALKMDKGSAMDLANRGLCRKFQGKSKEARQDLAAALELDPALDFAKEHLRQLEADGEQ